MFAVLAALLLAAAPAQPANTWKGKLCAADPTSGVLVGSDIYYTQGAAQVWTIGADRLAPIDLGKLVQAKARPFYVNNQAVALNGAKFQRYGLPRVLSAGELDPRPWATFEGMPFYHERDPMFSEINVVYLLTQAVGCEFQPYAKVR